MSGSGSFCRAGLALLLVLGLAPDAPAQQVDCQGGYMAEVQSLEAQHKAEAQSCRGNSQCIGQANAKKAAGQKAAGEKKYKCEQAKAGGQSQLKAGTATMEPVRPTRVWSQGGPNTMVYTDEAGRRWSFAKSIQEGGLRYDLIQGTPPKVMSGGGNLWTAFGYYRPANNPSGVQPFRGTLLGQ